MEARDATGVRVTVSVPSVRFSRERVQELVDALGTARAAIETSLAS